MVGLGRDLDEIVNTVQGPPGTGKTHVVTQAALDVYTNSNELLVVVYRCAMNGPSKFMFVTPEERRDEQKISTDTTDIVWRARTIRSWST